METIKSKSKISLIEMIELMIISVEKEVNKRGFILLKKLIIVVKVIINSKIAVCYSTMLATVIIMLPKEL